jgi:hypothetical protein
MGDRFATALSLHTLKLVRRAIELPVQVSCVTLEFFGCSSRASNAGSRSFDPLILSRCYSIQLNTALRGSVPRESMPPGVHTGCVEVPDFLLAGTVACSCRGLQRCVISAT